MKIPVEAILFLLAVMFLSETVGAAPEKPYLQLVVDDFHLTSMCPRPSIPQTIICEVLEEKAYSSSDGLNFYEQRFADACCLEQD